MTTRPAGAQPSSPKTIGLVASPPNLPGFPDIRLFEWLSAVFPVRFETRSDGDLQALDGAIYFGDAPRRAGAPAIPSLTFLNIGDTEPPSVATITFGRDAAVHRALRGRSIEQRLPGRPDKIKLGGFDAVFASIGDRPFWATRRSEGGRTDVTALPLPVVDQNLGFFHYFNKDNFVNLLPLVDFVRHMTGEDRWDLPPLRACFMFDDPNLHSTGYGFINFPKMVRHAAQCNYHVSMATIPLDGWFSSRQAAHLLVEQKSRISLLVHGNDHVKNELASFPSEELAFSSMAQALRRVARLEESTGVQISRVMAAPFGACSEGTMSVMARLGFEAACISSGSLSFHNARCSWTPSLGLRMAEIIEGLPVIPRFRLNSEAKNAILLAAYLGQPIVPVGHHQDVANGLDLLADLAQFINSLGCVQWSDMKSIARSNLLVCRNGDLLRVRPYSRRFQIAVPAAISRLSVEPPGGAFDAEIVTITTSLGAKPDFRGPVGSTVAVDPDAVLNITLERLDAIDPGSIPDRGFKSWAFIRRQLTESRDRLQPWRRRLGRWRAA